MDRPKRQTATATPAKPGGLPLTLASRGSVSIWRRGVFQVHAVDANGEIVVACKLGRAQLTPFFAALPPCVEAVEACASAHHWGRALIELGHEVRLLPAAHVKPYLRRNKSDQVDAAAIYEAMSRPGQRFVPVRSIENQAALMRHRARELLAFFRAQTRSLRPFRNSGSVYATRTTRAGNPIQHSNFW